MPRLWRHLDFSVARKPISLGCIQSNVRRSKGQTSHITFNRTSSTLDPSKTLRYVLMVCKKLEFMHVKDNIFNQSLLSLLPSARNLSTLIISSEITIDCTSQLLEHCPTLGHVEFHSISPRTSSRRDVSFYSEGDRILACLRVLLLKTSHNHDDAFVFSHLVRFFICIFTPLHDVSKAISKYNARF